MVRRPDPELALRCAADECFLATLRGETIDEADSYQANDRGVWTLTGANWKCTVATDSGHGFGVTVFAWRTDA